MSNFRIGDLVKISNPLSHYVKYKDTIHTVTKVDDEYVYLDIDDDCIDYVRYMDYELEHVDLGDDVEKWFQGQSTVNFIDEDCLDSFRYALGDFKTIDKYMKNEEENKMSDVMKIYEDKKENKVLKLWFERKQDDIEKKYDDLESKYIDEKYSIVKSYEEMVETFEKELEELYKYNNANEQFVLKENNTCNVFKYILDEEKLVEEAEQFYKEDKKKEMQDVLNEYNEINALLSMSEDLEYQQSVLIEYGIIDKKTKRMINEDNTK